jgi:drug/metabolite transporter (DMT)-like permease
MRGFAAPELGMLLVVLIWGANFSVVKAALAEIPPLAFTALRFAIATLLLLLLLTVREGRSALAQAGNLKLVGLGLVGNTLYQLFFIIGLARTTAANSALLIASTPVLVALLGRLFGVERITRRTALGILAAFAGIVLVMSARGLSLSAETALGDLLVFVAAIFWALYTLGVRALGPGISTLRITALTMLTGTPGLLLAGLPQLIEMRWDGVGLVGWGGLAYAAVLALVLAYAIWNASVRAVGSSRTAVYSCLIPLIAALVAWPLLGERPVPLQALGAVLILAGVLVARLPGRRGRPDAEIHLTA